MSERLTREQMTEKYPNRWLGLKNISYMDNDGVTLESAEVVYTDKSQSELVKLQIKGKEGIIAWYTSEDNIPLGLAGAL